MLTSSSLISETRERKLYFERRELSFVLPRLLSVPLSVCSNTASAGRATASGPPPSTQLPKTVPLRRLVSSDGPPLLQRRTPARLGRSLTRIVIPTRLRGRLVWRRPLLGRRAPRAVSARPERSSDRLPTRPPPHAVPLRRSAWDRPASASRQPRRSPMAVSSYRCATLLSSPERPPL